MRTLFAFGGATLNRFLLLSTPHWHHTLNRFLLLSTPHWHHTLNRFLLLSTPHWHHTLNRFSVALYSAHEQQHLAAKPLFTSIPKKITQKTPTY
ncbi:hypothetical protein [Shewanella oncorhynchi]|uniref:hypothetical protein n=1 Tax=Shewanella oncorhynchi TaxID=2726434 RepID=UPI003D7B1C90